MSQYKFHSQHLLLRQHGNTTRLRPTEFALKPYLTCRSVLFQARVLDFGLEQDRNIGVGVFPECEEVLERLFCFR